MRYDAGEVKDSQWRSFLPHPDLFSDADTSAIEYLDESLQRVLEEQNKRDDDFDGLIEVRPCSSTVSPMLKS